MIKMRFPKEAISLENEKNMMQWLQKNKHRLPLTLYGLCKEIGWTFGATRGTVLRLAQKPSSSLIIKDLADSNRKRFKTKIALKNTESAILLTEEEKDVQVLPSRVSNFNNTKSSLSEDQINKILQYLNKLKDLDNNVLKLGGQLPDDAVDKFLEYQFGLEKKEKEDLLLLISNLKEYKEKTQ